MPHYLARASGKEFDVKIDSLGDEFSVTVNGKSKSVIAQWLGGSRMLLLIDNHPHEIDIRSDGYDNRRLAFVKGTEIEVEIENFRLAQAKKVAGMSSSEPVIKSVKAPMPGLILEIKVQVGDKVPKHLPLVVIEAMKMENIIKSPIDATVKKVAVLSGESVEKNDILIEFE